MFFMFLGTGRGQVKVEFFVELRDTGYPGSYYTLIYDSESNRLVGVYNHLGLNQKFEVYFVKK